MHSTSRQTVSRKADGSPRRRQEALWVGAAAVCGLSGVHAVLAALPQGYPHLGWLAAAMLVVGPPLWAGLAFAKPSNLHRTHRFRIGLAGWLVAVAGLHVLYTRPALPETDGILHNSAMVWAGLWTAFFLLYVWNQPSLLITNLSPRQWWKLSGGAFAAVGIAFWRWPLLPHPLDTPGLLLFAGAVAVFTVGFPFSLCAYLERLGVGVSNWPLRRFIGTALHLVAIAMMMGSMVSATAIAGAGVLQDVIAAALASGLGAACIAGVAAYEWRYYRGLAHADD